MNQRIQQLYKQAHITREKQVRAGGWDNDREPFEYRTVTETNFDPEKFAELIVKECLTIAKNREDEFESAGLLNESNAVGNVAYRISRQFGVKR
jgi:hypothetical protein